MGGKSSAPKAPDPKDTSSAQTSTNIGSAIANNIMGMTSQYDPTGSLEYNQTGSQSWTDPYTGKTYSIPTYESVKRLNPTAQKTFGYNQQAEQNLAKLAQDQTKFLQSYLGQNAANGGIPELSKTRDDYEAALMERLQPGIDRNRQALETDLVNRGVNIGSEAYADAHSVQSQAENDARLAAILSAGQEEANQLQMAIQRRNQPINEITALLSGSQVQMPQFSGYQSARIPTTDVSGNIWNAYNANLSNWQTQQAQAQNLWGNLIGAGAKIATAGFA